MDKTEKKREEGDGKAGRGKDREKHSASNYDLRARIKTLFFKAVSPKLYLLLTKASQVGES